MIVIDMAAVRKVSEIQSASDGGRWVQEREISMCNGGGRYLLQGELGVTVGASETVNTPGLVESRHHCNIKWMLSLSPPNHSLFNQVPVA